MQNFMTYQSCSSGHTHLAQNQKIKDLMCRSRVMRYSGRDFSEEPGIQEIITTYRISFIKLDLLTNCPVYTNKLLLYFLVKFREIFDFINAILGKRSGTSHK